MKNYRDPELIKCKLYARYNNLAGIAFHHSKRLIVSHYCGYTRIKETLNVIFSLSYKKVFSKKQQIYRATTMPKSDLFIFFQITRLICKFWVTCLIVLSLKFSVCYVQIDSKGN